jgi:chromosomal replication initiation ATPase DnaA
MDPVDKSVSQGQQPHNQISIPKEKPSDKSCLECGRILVATWLPPEPNDWRGKNAGRWYFENEYNGRCGDCNELENKRYEEVQARRQAEELKKSWVDALGGLRAYEQYTLARFVPAGFKTPEGFPGNVNLYIHGSAGTGKTHLAAAIARECAKTPWRIITTSPISIFRDMRMSDGATEELQKMRRYVGSEILIIDDLGVSKDTDYTFQTLYEIIDGRYAGMRGGLIITSNLSLNELAGKLGDDRITSRIAGMCKIIKTNGPDRRLGDNVKA